LDLGTGVTEARDRQEHEAKENQTQRQAGFLAERLGQVDLDDHWNDEVDQRDEEKEQPPFRAADDLEEHGQVVDGDERLPAGLTGPGVDLPQPPELQDEQRHHTQEQDEAPYVAYDWVATPDVGWLPRRPENINRSAVVDNGVTTSYCYDNADTLVSTTDPPYRIIAYDARAYHHHPSVPRASPTTELTATCTPTTAIGRSHVLYACYVRDATERIVRREAASGYTSVVRYGYSGGHTPDFTLDADNHLIERTIDLLGGVL
jgi:hypothetical protein